MTDAYSGRPDRRPSEHIARPRPKVQDFLSSGSVSGLSLFGKWRRTQCDHLNDSGEIARALRLLPDLPPDDLRDYLVGLPCDLATLRKYDHFAASFRQFEREGRRLAKWAAGGRRYG